MTTRKDVTEMTDDKPKIGAMVKVRLRGESPWAEVVSISGDGFIGRIANKLFREYSEHEKAQFLNSHFGTVKQLPELHRHKQGDEIEFVKTEFGWEARNDR